MKTWLEDFQTRLDECFGERVEFVGLQGSYARGEATEESDIDPVVILDTVSAEDIRKYREMLDTLSHRDKICGFFSGKTEIQLWEESDVFQFYYDTKAIHGNLDELMEKPDADAVKRAIRIGVCNIYHGCVHNMLHDHSEEILRGLYKGACFTLKAIAFLKTGTYTASYHQLLEELKGEERIILERALQIKRGEEVMLDEMSETLLHWAGKWIREI